VTVLIVSLFCLVEKNDFAPNATNNCYHLLLGSVTCHKMLCCIFEKLLFFGT